MVLFLLLFIDTFQNNFSRYLLLNEPKNKMISMNDFLHFVMMIPIILIHAL